MREMSAGSCWQRGHPGARFPSRCSQGRSPSPFLHFVSWFFFCLFVSFEASGIRCTSDLDLRPGRRRARSTGRALTA